MILYRLVKSRYSRDIARKGAELCGGRWNSVGVPMLYTCPSRALAMAEVAVHLPLGILPKDFVMVTLYVPDEGGMKVLPQIDLPNGWFHYPPIYSTQRIGDAFIRKSDYLVLQVPSAVVHDDFVALINPHHPLFPQVKMLEQRPFVFDRRLFQHHLS
ncbi:RES family NAD+ phosphorylase [Olivibacter ginsenosidimutans]|uniref:RES family NAD+ phosphorylase n=1 Tax=Olivibacter ginsenosidimutans TaxID=1176537 RepID=A0ABP9CCL1_9SPHI